MFRPPGKLLSAQDFQCDGDNTNSQRSACPPPTHTDHEMREQGWGAHVQRAPVLGMDSPPLPVLGNCPSRSGLLSEHRFPQPSLTFGPPRSMAVANLGVGSMSPWGQRSPSLPVPFLSPKSRGQRQWCSRSESLLRPWDVALEQEHVVDLVGLRDIISMCR